MAQWLLEMRDEFIKCFITKDRWKYIVGGLGNTLKIALVAVLMGIVIGSVVAVIRATHDKTIERMRPGLGKVLLQIGDFICRVYLTVIRGTPVMIQIMIMFFVIFSNARDGVPVAMLTFGINSGAYVAEIIRGGIMSVDPRPAVRWVSAMSPRCFISSFRRRSKACCRRWPTSSSF